MKKLTKLKDVKALNKKEQRTINGGNGGSLICWVNGACIGFDNHCAEIQCQVNL